VPSLRGGRGTHKGRIGGRRHHQRPSIQSRTTRPRPGWRRRAEEEACGVPKDGERQAAQEAPSARARSLGGGGGEDDPWRVCGGARVVEASRDRVGLDREGLKCKSAATQCDETDEVGGTTKTTKRIGHNKEPV
jgi:hypothetical protein